MADSSLSENLFAPGHPNITPPADPDTKIWRYMSFAKYCAMLLKRQLYFASAAMLEDRWEGSQDLWYAAGVEVISFFTKVNWSGLSLDDFCSEWNRWIRGWTFVNCWHMNEGDSEAMWKLYASDEGSVALQSTYGRLRAALPSDIGIGNVYYIGYWATPPTPQPFTGYPTPFVFKRKSLEHERELRALVQKAPGAANGVVDLWNEDYPPGYTVDVDLGQLIESIHVQPDAPQWLVDIVGDVTKRYGVDVSISQAKGQTLF